MKYIFRFILLIHINCFSEEAGTFNFLKANEAVMKTLNTLETRNPGNLPTACHKIKDEQGFIVASC